MNKRFDTLFNLISKNNTVLERQLQQTNGNINETYLNNIKENITMETENRKRLRYQIYRAQELENCYKNLISQEQPYAPAKLERKLMKILHRMNAPFTDKPPRIILIVKSHFSEKDK